jgi:hypothetical protein
LNPSRLRQCDEAARVAGSGFFRYQLVQVGDGKVICPDGKRDFVTYTLQMLTRADVNGFSFGIFRDLSPASETFRRDP